MSKHFEILNERQFQSSNHGCYFSYDDGFLALGCEPWVLPGDFEHDLTKTDLTDIASLTEKTARFVNHPFLLDLLFCGAEVTQADR